MKYLKTCGLTIFLLILCFANIVDAKQKKLTHEIPGTLFVENQQIDFDNFTVRWRRNSPHWEESLSVKYLGSKLKIQFYKIAEITINGVVDKNNGMFSVTVTYLDGNTLEGSYDLFDNRTLTFNGQLGQISISKEQSFLLRKISFNQTVKVNRKTGRAYPANYNYSPVDGSPLIEKQR